MGGVKVGSSLKIKVSPIDFLIYTLMIIFFAFFLASFDYSSANGSVVLTFFLNGLFFLFMIIKSQKSVTIRRNIYIFNLIFFFFAPLQQYLEGTVLWRGNGMRLSYSDNDYVIANVLILVSSLLFELSYYYTRANKLGKGDRKRKYLINEIISPTRAIRMMRVGVVVSVLCSGILFATDGLSELGEVSAIKLQIRHMLLFTPVLYSLISIINIKNGIKNSKRYSIFFLINMIVVILTFSDIMARFLMLGAVMTIISFKLSNYRHKSVYLFIYILGFFFAFSMMRYVDLLETDVLHIVDFNQNDYDAYQMFMSVIEYTKKEGISWGMNFVSTLFCLIPRSIAPWRLEATGSIVIEYYGSWFTNVSSPLISEMYFSFGIIGVIILSLLFGIVVKKIDLMDLSNNNFKKGIFALISGLSIYLLRGAFLSAFSYTLGLLIAYCVIYVISYLKIK